jgi:hypothetical protein
VRLEHVCLGGPLRVGHEVLGDLGVGDEQQRIEQLVDTLARRRRDVEDDRVAAPLLRVLSASSRSTFVTATTIGTSAARAWLMASTVCGMTPSSAATTRIAMSVICAPRDRIAVNASWPGVSMKVMRRLSRCTWYAPMC